MLFYIIYVSVIFLLILLDYYVKTDNNIFELLAVVLVIVVSGLRDEVGYDFVTYRESYYSGIFDDNFEPGFRLLFKFLRLFDAHSQFLFFIMAVAIYSVFYIGIKKFTKHTGIAMMIFMLIPGLYLNSLSIIRQELAIGITFLAFYYLVKEKYATYALLMILAFLFHYSSITLIVFHIAALIFALKIKPIFYLIFIGLSIVFAKYNIGGLIVQQLLGESKYIIHLEIYEVNLVKILLLNFVVIVPLFFYKKLKVKKMNLYVVFFAILAVSIINIFSSFEIITRMAYYFRIYEAILVAEFVYLFKRYNRILALTAVYLFYMAMFIGSLNNDILADSHGQPKIIPFKTIFDN